MWNTLLTSGRFLRSRSPWFTSQLGLEKPYLRKKRKKKIEKQKDRKRKKERKKERKKGRYFQTNKISPGSGGTCI